MQKGFLLINKPKNWTSFDAVGYLRPKLRPPKTPENPKQKIKIGHAGTLDPFATGLLIVAVGREFTKKIDEFKNLPKTYEATIKLGEISDTLDSDGIITPYLNTENKNLPTKKQIKEVLKSFLGAQDQIPPMYSAKKINGERLYNLARAGQIVERKATHIIIYKIKLQKYSPPLLKLKIRCSAGTYIRTLADDIGKKLGCGAYCQELKRIKIGKFKLSKAINLPLTEKQINDIIKHI